MSKRIDLKGKKFGKLTIINFSHIGNDRYAYWKCKCECGNETIVRGLHLILKSTKTCICDDL